MPQPMAVVGADICGMRLQDSITHPLRSVLAGRGAIESGAHHQPFSCLRRSPRQRRPAPGPPDVHPRRGRADTQLARPGAHPRRRRLRRDRDRPRSAPGGGGPQAESRRQRHHRRRRAHLAGALVPRVLSRFPPGLRERRAARTPPPTRSPTSSPTKKVKVQLSIGSNDQARAWVNGQPAGPVRGDAHAGEGHRVRRRHAGEGTERPRLQGHQREEQLAGLRALPQERRGGEDPANRACPAVARAGCSVLRRRVVRCASFQSFPSAGSGLAPAIPAGGLCRAAWYQACDTVPSSVPRRDGRSP